MGIRWYASGVEKMKFNGIRVFLVGNNEKIEVKDEPWLGWEGTNFRINTIKRSFYFATHLMLLPLYIIAKSAIRKAITGQDWKKEDNDRLDDFSVERFRRLSPTLCHVVIDGKGTLVFPTDMSNISMLLFCINEIIINNTYGVSEEKIAGKIVYDVGANMGVFSSFCVLLGAKKVYAFEPSKLVFPYLLKTAELNSKNRIVPFNSAVGEKRGEVMFENTHGTSGGRVGFGSPVPITTLDSVVGSRMDFLKIDTEGYEENVIDGAKNSINKFKPLMSMEWHSETGRASLLKKCNELGYKDVIVDGQIIRTHG